ncbi:pimeloyl-ACP methyl ester carboxylesterase [Tamaricihabitans halophyticus]|uniref:Pimeloyl-ACP methyl ester carboxylesterase n=1 Tax=Tamaricihabitans halophyticus TaxID=1262583 RepID=A0A4V2SR23_9PSEU|nr:alpha/beta hydrolase [Tamaricihabitans halophyticus]TCP41216.1 pimeloyl-ACP methyl ester carboxylesterase [Tamaricihabitans halophyticus]
MVNTASGRKQDPRYLTVDGGRIAYDLQGEGPLVLLLPGMGELRSSYRFLAPQLVEAGYQVAAVDLRGHGDSDPTFDSYGDVETASDIAALLRHVGSPAVVVGNSMSAASAVIAAAEHPELTEALVLIGPFVRNPTHVSTFQRLLLRVALGGPWARAMWNAYLPTLYSGRKPDDFEHYRKTVLAAMKRPGYTKAFKLTTRADHEHAEHALGGVQAPSLVVMGHQDPDFADPAAEASWVSNALGSAIAIVDNAGHYPHAQQPRTTGDAIIGFLRNVHRHA